MKIAFAGKGGVGKTTLCASMALSLDAMGLKVLCVDADPDANLSTALGAGEITAISKDKEFLNSVVKQSNRSHLEGIYELTQQVDNVIERFAASWGRQSHVMTLGWSKNGGQGCYCSENNTLNAIIRSIPKGIYDYILIDGEAGLEHLSRGLTSKADLLVVVLQSGQRSIQTAQDAYKLAQDIGIKKTHLVLNGYVKKEEVEFIQAKSELPISFAFEFNHDIRNSDLDAKQIDMSPEYQEKINQFISLVTQTETKKEEDA